MAAYTEFTDHERQALTEPSLWPRLLTMPALAIGIMALAAGWPSDHLGWRLFWVTFTTYSLLCWGSILHETAHQTLGLSRNFNRWLGRFVGTLTLVPYSVYRESHIRHHAYLNRPRDWELWPYSDPTMSRTLRRWFAVLDLTLGAFVTPYIYGRVYWHKESPIKSEAIRRDIRFEYQLLAGVWGILLAGIITTYAMTPKASWSFWWLVPLLGAGSLQVVRKFTEHLGMSSYDPLHGTRTVIAESPLARLNSYFSLDIIVHGPHHRHPKVSHHQLSEKMAAYERDHPSNPHPIFPSYAAAVRHMIPMVWKNPGVGMNAGNTTPGEVRDNDCDRFVADVATEVLGIDDTGDLNA